ncbi:CHASE2 domain-containing serine/threonine-protein kinase [Sedimenticola thiotaurini]|uniref:non-specific serine/threonine protein kinase n=1 Tax=Sedimenticola thiotaurini TaxID=1543721 RepID=A0A0F7JW74_9GAMM|nr:serine/threonine-protein kinase [Sedimenticola thiotaurini]AKH20736.1 hypothetical protein AAY24_10665 [Sedimenticola thiotaurini]
MHVNYLREILIGLGCALLVYALSFTAPLQSLDRVTYDWGMRLADRDVNEQVVIVAIDEESIASLGRWPWSRDIHAALIDALGAARAKVIAYSVFFFEPQRGQGLEAVDEVLSRVQQSGLFELTGQVKEPILQQQLETSLGEFTQSLLEMRTRLDSDEALAKSLSQSANVILPMLFSIGKPLGNPDQLLPQPLQDQQLPVDSGHDPAAANRQALQAIQAFVPLPLFMQAAAGIGHLTVEKDIDGNTRSEPVAVDYYGTFIPSVAVQAVIQYLNLTAADIHFIPGQLLRLGGLEIRLDDRSRMNNFYYQDQYGRTPFRVESFVDVVSGRTPPRHLQDKIVLVGATAAGIGDTQATAVDSNMPPVVALGHTISSLLNEDFIVTPGWSRWAALLAFVLVTLYLVIWVPRGGAAATSLTSLLLVAVLMAVQLILVASESLWIPLMSPVVLLLLGHTLISTSRFLMSEKAKRDSDLDSAESNRMLGLSFQGQGQLDMAFDKFRKCPLDEKMLDLLYNLGLDFERKRQFNKAVAVYQYMAELNPDFKDIAARQDRSQAMDQSIMLTPRGGVGDSLVLNGSGVEKPMLGRYEVLKELGKGAMGIVYLGQDPKISRTVAIKTMALSQEFEGEELEEVKGRFFREAETAGRLNHPHIVTIYDAGEEQDLAYIAMEFLHGCELTEYTRPDKLLPISQVLLLMADAADALGYADEHNVVHRDIKPANVLFNPETGNIKLTDFGIARIIDSSKTRTGTVLGTPSYMSPEQFAGKKADGRADLFSLGVMTFQLLTGKLPFVGDSMASLMYAITSSEAPDPRQYRPELPECVGGILQVALSKDAEDRYQNGYEMAADLRQCAALADQQAG